MESRPGGRMTKSRRRHRRGHPEIKNYGMRAPRNFEPLLIVKVVPSWSSAASSQATSECNQAVKAAGSVQCGVILLLLPFFFLVSSCLPAFPRATNYPARPATQLPPSSWHKKAHATPGLLRLLRMTMPAKSTTDH